MRKWHNAISLRNFPSLLSHREIINKLYYEYINNHFVLRFVQTVKNIDFQAYKKKSTIIRGLAVENSDSIFFTVFFI